MIFVFTGNDKTLIEEKIGQLLKQHKISKYDRSELPQQAYLSCLTRNLIAPTATLLSTSQKDLDLDLKLITELVESKNILLIVSENWNNRTKLGQALQPYLTIETKLPNSWNLKDINLGIDFYAERLGLNLTFEVKEYLRLALNNDFAQLRSGLSTIALLSNSPSLDLVSQIIPSEYANSIELKTMILQKKKEEISNYIIKLKNQIPSEVIISSLITQFDILLQTAIAIKQNMNDQDIAQFAGIRNVKQLYFLRSEIRQISIEQMIWLNRLLKDTQNQLKFNNCNLSAKLVLMCYW